jgi:hypothetical protein
MEQALSFTSSNLDRFAREDSEKVWKDVSISSKIPIDTLSRLAVELLWVSCKLNVMINHMRSAMGYMQIDFDRDVQIYEMEMQRGEREANGN